MKKIKGKFRIVEDLLPNDKRESLPINLFLLRVDDDMEEENSKILYASCSFYNTDKMIVGYFYKSISNIL
jgi:hypothetical protein